MGSDNIDIVKDKHDLKGGIKCKRDEKLKAKVIVKRKKKVFWTELEKERFLQAVNLHGRNWVEVAKHVGTKDYMKVSRYGNGLMNKLKI